MFQKKVMNMKAYENGANPYGNRYGNSGGFQDSLDTKKAGLEKWKVAEGENLIDIIPFNATAENPLVIAGKAEVGDPMYSLDYFVHRGVGPNKSNVTCLTQYEEDCPLCRESERIKALGGKENEDKAFKLKSKRRVVYVVHDLKTGKFGYWDTGYKSVEEPVMTRARLTKDPKTQAPANVFDWHDGMSLQFLGTKKKFEGKDFNEPSGFGFVPRDPLTDDVLEHSIDLATVIKKTSAEDMEKLISGKAYAVQSKDSEKAAPSEQPEVSEKPVESTPEKKEEPVSEAPAQEVFKCPKGYTFGDADKHPDCTECDSELWEKCFDCNANK